ncbi:MAG: hypothetical protein ABIJ21_03500 [Nanoarchaeota archaeon]
MSLYVSSGILRSIMQIVYRQEPKFYRAILIGRDDEENGVRYVTGIFVPQQSIPKDVHRLTIDDFVMNYDAWRKTKVGQDDVVGMLLYQKGNVIMGIPKKAVKKKKHLLNVFGLFG